MRPHLILWLRMKTGRSYLLLVGDDEEFDYDSDDEEEVEEEVQFQAWYWELD